jgi:hypothetical protein
MRHVSTSSLALLMEERRRMGEEGMAPLAGVIAAKGLWSEGDMGDIGSAISDEKSQGEDLAGRSLISR